VQFIYRRVLYAHLGHIGVATKVNHRQQTLHGALAPQGPLER